MEPLQLLETKVLTSLVTKFPHLMLMGIAMCPMADMIPGAVAEWDELRNSRALAPYNTFGNPGKVDKNLDVYHQVNRMACVRQKRVLKGMQLYHLRQPGGDWASQWAEQRVRQEMEDLTNQVKKTWEHAFWEMLKGTLTVAQEDVQFTVDYNIAVSHKPTAATLWSDTANADPIANLRAWKKLITQDLGEQPTDLFVSSTVMGYLVDNAKVRELMRQQYGRQMAEEGRIVKLAGLNVVEYDNGYVPEGGSYTQFVPDTHCYIIAKGNTRSPEMGGKITNNLCDIQQGSPEDLEAGGKPGLFSKSWTEKDPAGVQALVASTFLPALKKPEGVVYAEVA